LNLQEVTFQPVQKSEQKRFQSLMQTHHYLDALPRIGHTLRYDLSCRQLDVYSRVSSNPSGYSPRL